MESAFQSRNREINKVLIITLFLNFLVAGAKLGYGYYTETLSMVADGFHSLLDGSSNIVGLIAIAFAAKPADRKHPYGHRKIEALASMFISGMLFWATYEIISHAYLRLHHKIVSEVTVYSFLIMIGTMAINYGVSRYEHRKGHELGSQILTADSAHTKSDVFASLSVIIALIGIKLKLQWVDLAAAGLIGGFVAYSGYKIIYDSISTLLDTAQLNPEEVIRHAETIDGVKKCHNIRTRGHSTAVYMDLNIHVDPKLTTEQAHAITHKVMSIIKQKIPEVVDVVVHTEPATEDHE